MKVKCYFILPAGAIIITWELRKAVDVRWTEKDSELERAIDDKMNLGKEKQGVTSPGLG